VTMRQLTIFAKRLIEMPLFIQSTGAAL